MKFVIEHTFDPFNLDRYWEWLYSEKYFEYFSREGSRQNYILHENEETDDELKVVFETRPDMKLPKFMMMALQGEPIAFREEHRKSKKEFVDRLNIDLLIKINLPYSTVGVDTWTRLDDGRVKRHLDMDLNVRIKFFRKKAEESLVKYAKGGQLAYNKFIEKWVRGDVDPGFKIADL